MDEKSMNALFGIVSDPIKNAYDSGSYKNLSEIQRIIRIFEINKKQKSMVKEISARGLVAFKMLVSNN